MLAHALDVQVDLAAKGSQVAGAEPGNHLGVSLHVSRRLDWVPVEVRTQVPSRPSIDPLNRSTASTGAASLGL